MTRTSKWIAVSLLVMASLPLAFVTGCDYSESSRPQEVKWQTTDTLWFSASGSTFIAPLLNRWGHDYEKEHKVHLNYQPIGSGGGIKNLRQGMGAFAASDAPLSDADLKGLPDILQIPVTAGPVCVIYNLPGIMSPLKLDGKTLAAIFAGDIISWQDPSIARENPGMKLPMPPSSLSIAPMEAAQPASLRTISVR